MAAVVIAAAGGLPEARAVLTCWQWCSTLDPALEAALRAGADHFPSARADLADLLRTTDRVDEARAVLERGAKLGESESWLPLGNLYRDHDEDAEAAEAAYRAGIARGDDNCHLDLGLLLERQGDDEGARGQFTAGARGGDALAELDDEAQVIDPVEVQDLRGGPRLAARRGRR